MKKLLYFLLTAIFTLTSIFCVACKNSEEEVFGNGKEFSGEYELASDEEKVEFLDTFINAKLKTLSETEMREYNFERQRDLPILVSTYKSTIDYSSFGSTKMVGAYSIGRSVVGIGSEIKNNFAYDNGYYYYTELDESSTSENPIVNKLKKQCPSEEVLSSVNIVNFDIAEIYGKYAGGADLYFDYGKEEETDEIITKLKINIKITEAVKQEIKLYFESEASDVTVKSAEYYYVFLISELNEVIGWRKYITCKYDTKSEGDGSSVVISVDGRYISEMLIIENTLTLPTDLNLYVDVPSDDQLPSTDKELSPDKDTSSITNITNILIP